MWIDSSKQASRNSAHSLPHKQRLVSLYGAVSPAVTTYEGLTALAGTDVRRHLHFEHQIDQFHAAWKSFFEPRILNGLAITEPDLDRIPRFTWREEEAAAVRAGIVSGLIQLIVPTIVFAGVGFWRLRRYTVA